MYQCTDCTCVKQFLVFSNYICSMGFCRNSSALNIVRVKDCSRLQSFICWFIRYFTLAVFYGNSMDAKCSKNILSYLCISFSFITWNFQNLYTLCLDISKGNNRIWKDDSNIINESLHLFRYNCSLFIITSIVSNQFTKKKWNMRLTIKLVGNKISKIIH